jgi:uncharacterized protein (TIGR03067 family)
VIRPTIALLMALASSAYAAPIPKELKHRDYGRYQGLWTFETYDRGGREIGGGRWIFEGDKMYANGRNTTDDKGTEFRFELRPNRAPAEIDIYYGPTVRCSGIYEFIGQELRIAYFHGAERPVDFSSAVGKDVFLIRRVPEAKK